MKNTVHVYYWTVNDNGRRERADILYKGVYAMRSGTAAQILGPADADGNGVPRNAPLVQLLMEDGTTATYDADNVTVLF